MNVDPVHRKGCQRQGARPSQHVDGFDYCPECERHVTNQPKEANIMAAATSTVTLTDVLDANLIEAGTKLEADYRGKTLRATVLEDGRVRVNRNIYGSLSKAAKEARENVSGSSYYVSGWTFWKLPDGRPVDVLRKEAEQVPA